MPNNIAAYRISVRSKKWWWPLFDYLLDVAMQNAWLIYRQTAGAVQQSLDQLDFCLFCVLNLLRSLHNRSPFSGTRSWSSVAFESQGTIGATTRWCKSLHCLRWHTTSVCYVWIESDAHLRKM